jgi:hypothetical protein
MSVGTLWRSCYIVIDSDDGHLECNAVPRLVHDQQPVERVPWTHTYEIVQQNTVIRRAPKSGRMRAGSGGDFPSRRDGSIQPSAISDRLDEHGLIG